MQHNKKKRLEEKGWKVGDAKEFLGLSDEEVRKISGYHDEPLHGNRLGQRSIRLSRAYQAIYRVYDKGSIEFVSVEEVSKHAY